MDVKALIETVSAWVVEHGLRILLVLILMFIFIKIAQAATGRFFRGFKKGRRETDEEFKKRPIRSALLRPVSSRS